MRGAHTGPRAAAARRSHAARERDGVARPLEEGGRGLECGLGLRSASAPRLDLGEVGEQRAVVGPERDRLAEEPGRLVQRADAHRVARRASQGAGGVAVAAGEQQMVRDLGRAARVVVGRDGRGDALVHPRPVGLGQVGVGGLAQERVAVADPAARGDEDPGLDGGGRGARRVGDRQPVELVAVEAATGRRDALGEEPGLRGQRRARGAYGAAQARRRLVLAARERAGRLHGEQRVALGGGDDLRDVARGQRRDRPRQPRHVAGLKRRQLDRRAQDAAGAERLLDARRPRGAAGAGGG